jgi:hypothetical protein
MQARPENDARCNLDKQDPDYSPQIERHLCTVTKDGMGNAIWNMNPLTCMTDGSQANNIYKQWIPLSSLPSSPALDSWLSALPHLCGEGAVLLQEPGEEAGLGARHMLQRLARSFLRKPSSCTHSPAQWASLVHVLNLCSILVVAHHINGKCEAGALQYTRGGRNE